MTVFMVQDENPLKYGVMIDAFHAGARQPAILVSGPQNGFPANARDLASNFANLLNGSQPQERPASDGQAVHYQKHAHGITLHHRDPEAGGVSIAGLQFTVVDSLPKAERAEVLGKLTAHFMRDFCGSIDTHKKAELASAAPTAPKNAPQF